MRTEIAGMDLLLRRRSLLWYAFGMGLYALVVIALYPTFKDDSGLDDFASSSETMAALFGVSGSLTSPVGWLNANIYGNFLPLVVLLVTVGYGGACLAGQNEEGTLGLLATEPLSRRTIVAQKFGAMTLLAIPVCVVTALCVVIGREFELSVDYWALTGTTVGVILLGVVFGALAMAIGAATGSRGAAVGITSAVAATAYLLNSLAPVVNWLHPFRFLSPFFYATGDNQLEDGMPLGWLAILVAIAAVLLVATVAAFERLDIN
ncbi:ABC transporter permease subunit [Rhodococcus gannanensis]|uniref:ABC transporter permease subunit n=1 Tax=Rhodococcus gannanensis TaxID=1960308 RepID=A0ABW4PB36_9NOCA